MAQEYYSPPIQEEAESPEESSTGSGGQIGWETRGELYLSTGAGVEGRSLSQEDGHLAIWQEIGEKPLHGGSSNHYVTAGRSDHQDQGNDLVNTSVQRELEESDSFYEHHLAEANLTLHEEPSLSTNSSISISHTAASSETTERSELPFLAGNPASPTSPTRNLPLPRPASRASKNQASDDDDVSPGLTMEESQRRYYTPSSSTSCMCPCACSSTTQPPRQENTTTKKYPTVTTSKGSRSRATKRPRYRSRYLRPPQTAKPPRKTTTTTSAKMRTENYGRYTSDVGFNYPDFETFGEFGSVIKSKPEEPKQSPSPFYEAPSNSELLLPSKHLYYQNTTSLPPKPTFVNPNVVFTTPLPGPYTSQFSALPPAKPILPPPEEPFYEISSSEDNSFSIGPNVMLSSSSAPAIFKAPSPSEFVSDTKYQTHFKDALDSPLFYQQLPSMKKQTVYHITRADSKAKAEVLDDDFNKEYEAKTKEISAPQNMKIIFDFPCARSAVYDLNFVFKFCRKMGIFDEEVR